MSSQLTIKVLEQSHVAPPQGSVATTICPLTFLDRAWFFCCPIQRLFFYEFPYPTLHFTQTILPHLKQSLSLTLHHFFPLAANLICPPPPNEPYILYTEGESVSFTVAESDADFNYLVANHARDAREFHSLVPKLHFASVSAHETNVVPIMAVQVTVFPNCGISIGITFIHVVADGKSFNHFLKSWASIYKSGGADLTSPSPPSHNKDVIKDPGEVSSIFLKDWWSWENLDSVASVTEENVRVTLVISRVQIEKLKERVIIESRNNTEARPLHVSTYVVACGLMWVNLIKLQESGKISDELHDDLIYRFVSVADCRDRFSEFPVPAAYFGNCLAWFFVQAKRSGLMGENGIIFAAKSIGRRVSELEKGPLIGAEKWVSDLKEALKGGRVVSVAGSPRLRVYETDFGWGRPKKSEVVHIGPYGSFSLAECRDEEGGVEIGLVLGRDKLPFFNAIFEQWLN